MKPIKMLAAASLMAMATGLQAQDVRITTFKSDSTFTLNGQTFTIARNQDQSAVLTDDLARTSRACPPDCLQPLSLGDGVTTLGELEVLTFLEQKVTESEGLLLDSRSPAAFASGSIPGAVNVPSETLTADNRFRDDILRALGAVSRADGALDFSGAMTLALFSGGAWSSDAPAAISNLLAAGYPPEKLLYYRGGIQSWALMGFPLIPTQNPG